MLIPPDTLQLACMLLSYVHDTQVRRVYVTRYCSVVSFFEDDPASGGMQLTTQPGLFVYPADYERAVDAVRTAALSLAAERLGIPVDQVLLQPLQRLKAVADPDLDEYYQFARRGKARSPFRR